METRSPTLPGDASHGMPKSIIILIILVLPGLLAGGGRDLLRWRAEARDTFIETVMDFDELRTLARQEGWRLQEMLVAAAERGASSVGISEDTLHSLETEGRISILNLADLRQMAVEGDVASYGTEIVEPQGALWIWSQESGLLDRIEHHLGWKLPGGRVRRVSLNLLIVRRSGEDFKTRVGLGFSKEYLSLARECGLGIVLRIYNHPGLTAGAIRSMIAGLPDPADVSAIVFAEEEVLGSRGALAATIDELTHRSYRIGWVEFNDQDGMDALLEGLRGKRPFVRVHSIGRKELDENYNVSRAIARWVRAVRERRLKMLYMRCFFQDKKKFIGDLVQFNLDYLGAVVKRLQADGFQIPRLDEQRRDEPRHMVGKASPAERLAIGLALLLGVPLLLAATRWRYPAERDIWLTFGVAAGAWSILPVPLFIAFAGLVGAIAWSTLGCIWAMGANEASMAAGKPASFGGLAGFFLRLSLPGFLGGALVAALHAETIYLLKFEQFRGIKLAFIAPLAWTAVWALRRYGGGLLTLFARPLTVRELFIGLAVGGGTLLYLLRSGNVTFLKPSAMEDIGRTFLENLLIARPRNKEFLIGYPAALFFLFFRRRGVSEILPVLALFMQMGQVSLVNTFCHFHSPLSLAFLRGFNGLWTGLLTGAALLAVYLVCRVLACAGCKSDRSVLVGYFGFGNLGDELLWRSFAEEAARRRPDLKWSVIWGPAEWEEKGDHVRAVSRRDLLGLLEELAAARAVVVPGGSLLQATTSLGSLLYYLALLAFGRLLGARLILCGQGFGPWGTPGTVQRYLAASAARMVLEFASYISCRDREAAMTLARLPGPALSAAVGADLAFLRPRSGSSSRPPAGVKTVGVILRGSFPMSPVIAERLAGWAKTSGYRILPLAFQLGEDEEPWRNQPALLPVTILRDAAAADETFASCEFIVTMRLHAAVLATIAGVPWIGLAVDPKMTGLAAELGWQYVLPPEEADAARLDSCIRQVCDCRETLAEKLRTAAAGRAFAASADLDAALRHVESYSK
ncbi:MAG TPA: DUF5693 family protein [Candidatus Ozemobacteraceae bacterium]|nr:DUF5693 family protein [Candidatus Ozemobacteraceae bacterium]HQG27054.1 DUF5693 family protein [Candidatus Ozemobacteraceae bacterium]